MKAKLTKIVQYLDDILNFKDKEYTDGEPWHPCMLCSHGDTWEPVQESQAEQQCAELGDAESNQCHLSSS